MRPARLREHLPTLRRDERRFLTWNEETRLRVRAHWSVLARPLLETVAVLVVASWLSAPPGVTGFDRFLGYVVVGALLRLVWYVVQWWMEEIVVTDKRIFKMSGIVIRSIASMPLVKVTDMTYRRSLTGRLLGYGELTLESAGQQQALSKIDYVPDPDQFYRELTSLVFEGSTRGD